MSENCVLTFGTVTLSRELLLKPMKTQLSKTHARLRFILSRYYIQFELAIELTKTGNIHYHFKAISYKSEVEQNNILVIDELKTDYKYFGFSKIDAISVDNGIDGYLVKSIEATERIFKLKKIDLNSYPIICNKETKILKEKCKIKLGVLQTTFLDVLDQIEEEIADVYFND